MSDLVGNLVVGFPTRRLICYRHNDANNMYVPVVVLSVSPDKY